MNILDFIFIVVLYQGFMPYVSSQCDGRALAVGGQSGTITSPNFDGSDGYGKNLNCLWEFSPPENHILTLNVVDIKLHYVTWNGRKKCTGTLTIESYEANCKSTSTFCRAYYVSSTCASVPTSCTRKQLQQFPVYVRFTSNNDNGFWDSHEGFKMKFKYTQCPQASTTTPPMLLTTSEAETTSSLTTTKVDTTFSTSTPVTITSGYVTSSMSNRDGTTQYAVSSMTTNGNATSNSTQVTGTTSSSFERSGVNISIIVPVIVVLVIVLIALIVFGFYIRRVKSLNKENYHDDQNTTTESNVYSTVAEARDHSQSGSEFFGFQNRAFQLEEPATVSALVDSQSKSRIGGIRQPRLEVYSTVRRVDDQSGRKKTIRFKQSNVDNVTTSQTTSVTPIMIENVLYGVTTESMGNTSDEKGNGLYGLTEEESTREMVDNVLYGARE